MSAAINPARTKPARNAMANQRKIIEVKSSGRLIRISKRQGRPDQQTTRRQTQGTRVRAAFLSCHRVRRSLIRFQPFLFQEFQNVRRELLSLVVDNPRTSD